MFYPKLFIYKYYQWKHVFLFDLIEFEIILTLYFMKIAP